MAGLQYCPLLGRLERYSSYAVHVATMPNACRTRVIRIALSGIVIEEMEMVEDQRHLCANF